MGAFDETPNILIPDDEADPQAAAAFRKRWNWDPHEVVMLRGSYTAGDAEVVNNASMQTDKQGKPIMVFGTGRLALLTRMIVDWTLAKNGRKVEVTPAAIRRLPANYTTPILERCDELAKAMTEEEQEDFLAGVNGHTVDASNETSLSLTPF